MYPNGQLLYVPRGYIQTHCNVNYQNWPWGNQNCTFKAGSWTYEMKELDIQPYVGSSNTATPLSFKHFINKNQVKKIKSKVYKVEGKECPPPLAVIE